MSKTWIKWVMALGLGCFVLSGQTESAFMQVSRADELEVTSVASFSEAAADDLHDPAFDRYVKMSDIGSAWASQDPSAMTDCALMILEGERILLRPHSKLSGENILTLAGKLATEKRDAAALERLKKAAELHGKKDVVAGLASSAKLGAAARGDDSLTISIDETSPEEYEVCREYCDRIRMARIAGDLAALKVVQEELQTGESTGGKRDQLLALVQKAVAAVPTDKPVDPTIVAISRLGAQSRGWGINDVERYVENRASTAGNSVRTEVGRGTETLHSIYKPSPTHTDRRSTPKIHYTLRNATNVTVRFRLPSGKTYYLSPGESGKYQNDAGTSVYIFNSDHSYKLFNGGLKFVNRNGDIQVAYDR